MTKIKVALLLCVAACSPEPENAPDARPADPGQASPAAGSAPLPNAPVPAPSAEQSDTDALTLDGLGMLRIGEPVPASGGWAERGAQISDECRIVTSPEFPGVYAIVEQGSVRRITLGERSEVTLAGGIAVGMPEAEVRAAFPSLREEPRAYVEPPAKYLTAPGATASKPAVRFETNSDGLVSDIHVGTTPVLGYIEGCA